MVPVLQELREKLASGSSFLRSSGQEHVSLSPDDQAMQDRLEPLVKAFKLRTLAELKVVLGALILSECVYKLVDIGEQESAKAASSFISQFPPGLVSLQHIQSANMTVPHRYMLGDDEQSLYVVFMGTKHMRDLLSDANFLQEAVWKSKDDKQQQAGALAHRGFLARARHIPVEALYAHARSQGKSLVLCGHSLGGAVALLCTLRLLQGLSGSTPSLHCICFGTPAIGNAALAAVVAEHGWESHILNFILPEDMIPRMLALPAVPKPEEVLSAAATPQQEDSGLGTEAVKSAASHQAAAGAVRSRLQNLRAVLTARRADTRQVDAALAQPASQQRHQDDNAELSSNAAPPVAAADVTKVQDLAQPPAQAECRASADLRADAASTVVLPAERPGRPVLQSIRSIASRLPSFTRSQSLPDSAETPLTRQLQPGALRDDAASLSTERAPACASKEELQLPADSQAPEAQQGSRMWRLQDRVQGVWLGASNRVKALRPLLPAYPAYVHIGSHQILLPASPAMSKALKDAQQQGLAEERQQALNMHRMSAYRGRAVAICRSTFGWKYADTAAQIRLSTTLAPPVTLIHSSLIIPPLLIPDMHSTDNQADQSLQATKPASPARQQAWLQHSPSSIARSDAAQAQVEGDPRQQRQSPQPPVLAAERPKLAEPKASMAKPATPVSQQIGEAGPSRSQSGHSSTGHAEQLTQTQKPHSAAAQSIQSQAATSPKRWRWQRPLVSSQQAPALESGSVAGMQGAPAPVQQHETSPQGQHQTSSIGQTVASSGSRDAAEDVSEARPSRWLPSVGLRWQGGKQKPPPKALVQICVQGSVHSMPLRAQLRVMGHTWCRAKLIPSSRLQHRVHSPVASVGQQPGDASWRHLLMHRLSWLRPQPIERQQAQTGMLLFQAEVPVVLLRAIVDETAQQMRDQQQQHREQNQPSSHVFQTQQSQSPTEQPAMLFRLHTDFQTQEQAVRVRLPVVWLLGPHPSASQAVWQMLTVTGQAPPQASAALSNLPVDGKASSAWQSAQHKFRQALSMVQHQGTPGQLKQLQPQLETAVLSGVHYAHIQATGMQSVDMLSCLLMLLTQLTRDSVGGKFVQLGGSLQKFPARLRAVYYRQELQHLQTQLQHLGPPSGVLLAHGGSVDLNLSHAVTLFMKQASVIGIMRLGVMLSRGAHVGPEGLFSIGANDWIELHHHNGNAPAGTQVVRMQQRLQASLTAVVSGLSPSLSKL